MLVLFLLRFRFYNTYMNIVSNKDQISNLRTKMKQYFPEKNMTKIFNLKTPRKN